MLDAESWREVDRIFAAALELPAAERAAFLDTACGGDADLRKQVEDLLDADRSDATFLERPAGELAGWRPAGEDEDSGGRLGPYRLLRRIGGGGMGTVYQARRDDQEYQSEVAVKVLRAGLEETEAYHRFLAERQILARLQHPNIARLYDGGTTADGRPFLVMELVDGLPIDKYCDSHQLTVDQRLDLFRRVCSAVEHAHQHLLVHRDIKPANILVTPEGEPKLLDFGIAKQLEPRAAAESGPRTRTGLRVMTPSYASPEQVRGEAVTTASDVYSLGVLLYELLAGRSPYPASEVTYEIERAICEQEPEKPSAALFRAGTRRPEEIAQGRGSHPQALRRRLQGDLDNIILMALRKEPGRRYRAVAQLSRDLERHLHDLPVAARPDTLPYRTRKFVQRHKIGVAVAAMVIALVAGFVGRLHEQRRQLELERDKARYALSFLVETFKNADPYQTRGAKLTAEEILAQGAKRVSRDLKDSPDVQAAVLDAIGEVNLGLGRTDVAEPLLTRSLELRRQIYGPDSLEVADSLGHLSSVRQDRSDPEGGERLLRQRLDIQRRRLGERHLEVAKTLNRLAYLRSEMNATPEIEKLYQEALGIARETEGPVGETGAETLINWATLKRNLGDYAAAEKLFRDGLEIERQALGAQDPRLYGHQTEFGEILIDQGRYKESEALLRQTLTAQGRIFGPKHPAIFVTLNNLGQAVHRQGRYTESEELNRRLLELSKAQFGPQNYRTGVALGNLAASLIAQERHREAIPYLREALEVRRATWGDRHPLVAQALLLLADAHRSLDEFDRGLELAHQSLAILEETEGPDHPHVAYALRELGNNYLDQDRPERAEPYLRRCLEIRKKELTADNPELARAKTTLAKCLIGMGRYDEAEALIREAEPILLKMEKHAKLIHELRAELAQVRRVRRAIR